MWLNEEFEDKFRIKKRFWNPQVKKYLVVLKISGFLNLVEQF